MKRLKTVLTPRVFSYLRVRLHDFKCLSVALEPPNICIDSQLARFSNQSIRLMIKIPCGMNLIIVLPQLGGPARCRACHRDRSPAQDETNSEDRTYGRYSRVNDLLPPTPKAEAVGLWCTPPPGKAFHPYEKDGLRLPTEVALPRVEDGVRESRGARRRRTLHP